MPLDFEIVVALPLVADFNLAKFPAEPLVVIPVTFKVIPAVMFTPAPVVPALLIPKFPIVAADGDATFVALEVLVKTKFVP